MPRGGGQGPTDTTKGTRKAKARAGAGYSHVGMAARSRRKAAGRSPLMSLAIGGKKKKKKKNG